MPTRCSLGVTVLWAGNYSARQARPARVRPGHAGGARALFAVPLLLLVSRLLEGPLPPLARRDYRGFAVLSLSGFVGNTALWYGGLRLHEPGQRGNPGRGRPGGDVARGGSVLRERVSPVNLAGIGLTLVAVLLTITQGSLRALPPSPSTKAT